MSRAIYIEGVLYVPATEAGRTFGYSSDYISRLAREQKIVGSRIGKQWFVVPESVSTFVVQSEKEKAARAEQTRRARIEERRQTPTLEQRAALVGDFVDDPADRLRALLRAGCVAGAGTVLGALMFLLAHGSTFPGAVQVATAIDARQLAYDLYRDVARLGGTLSAGVADSSENDVWATSGSTTPQGIVVFDPSVTSADAIERQFSDEVEITRDADGASGSIRPVFRNSTDVEYRYLMVPVDSP